MIRAVLAGLLLCTCAAAQTTLREGRGLAALWAVDGGVAVQFGRSVQRLRASSEGAAAEAAVEVEAGVQLFDWDGRLVQIRGALARVADEEFDLLAPPVSWSVPVVPLRVRLLQGESLTLPHRDGVLWINADKREVVPSAPVTVEEAGYGFGDTHQVTRAHAWALRSSPELLFVGAGSTALRVQRGAPATTLHWTPGGADHLGGFPWSVPPLLADFGSAGPTLVLADAASGLIGCFRGSDSGVEPAQVLRLEGGLIATALFQHAGVRHVLVLRTRKLGLVDQLDILKSGRLPVELMDFPVQDDGSLPRSPRGRVSASLPIAFSINNDLRAVSVNAAVFMTAQTLLVAESDGRVLRYSIERGPPQEIAALGPGRALDPFGAIRLGTEWVFGWLGENGQDRVLSLKLSDK
ncbi:MAG: hypothetical protein EXS14_04910 [Planctomycetes bacterium]|nr:hypothetical protein [Planctomycetota bacterium]